jgi:rare lipoprotein A
MSYADRRVRDAASPFDALGAFDMDADDVIASWKRTKGEPQASGEAADRAPTGSYLAAGTFPSAREADERAKLLASLGDVTILRDGDAFSVVIPAEERSLDAIARAAWQAGADDAFVVRAE